MGRSIDKTLATLENISYQLANILLNMDDPNSIEFKKLRNARFEIRDSIKLMTLGENK